MSRWGWTLLLSLCWCSLSGADSTVNVPLEHPIYDFVERFEARGVLAGMAGGIRPFSRLHMAQVLQMVAAAADEGLVLSAVERANLERYEAEFAGEMGREVGGSAGERLRDGDLLYLYQGEEGEVAADLLFRQRTDRFSGRGRRDVETVFRHSVGGIVRGRIGERIGFRTSFIQTREQGSRQYTWREQVFERRLEIPQLKGNLADYHEAKAYVKLSLPHVDVEFGKDNAAWGPGQNDNLGLSANAPSFTMLRLQSRLGALKFVSIAGALRPCPDRPDSPLCRGSSDSLRSYIVNRQSRTLDRPKYLAAHRLEVALAPWIDLGFHEIVIYGDRGLEPTYLNPFMFYWAAQSYLGDKDNVMMGFDVDIHPGRNRRYYLSYVIDDLKKLAIFSNDFANKFSLQAGLFWVDPPGLRDADLRLEYVRIEPWIYTHRFPINTFRNFDSPLGSALAPNSDSWSLVINKRFSSDLLLNLRVERRRHGANEVLADGQIRNVGGDLNYGWRPGDERDSKDFLDGVLGRRTQLGLDVQWRLLPHLVAEWGYAQEWGDNVPLPPNWGAAVPLDRRTGYGDGVQRQLRFDLRYHYF